MVTGRLREPREERWQPTWGEGAAEMRRKGQTAAVTYSEHQQVGDKVSVKFSGGRLDRLRMTVIFTQIQKTERET